MSSEGGEPEARDAEETAPPADRRAAVESTPARVALLVAVGATLAATFVGAYWLFGGFFPTGGQALPALLATVVTAAAGVTAGTALADADAVDATTTARTRPVVGGALVRLVPLGWLALAVASGVALFAPVSGGEEVRPWLLLGLAVVAGLLGLAGTALFGRRSVGRPWHAVLAVVGGLGVVPAAALGGAAAFPASATMYGSAGSLGSTLTRLPALAFVLAVVAAAVASLAALLDSSPSPRRRHVTVSRSRRTALLAGAWLVCGSLFAPTLSFLFDPFGLGGATALFGVANLGLVGLAVLAPGLLLGSARLARRGRRRDRALVLCGAGVVAAVGFLANAGLLFVGPYVLSERLLPSHGPALAVGAALGALLVPLSVASAVTTVRVDAATSRDAPDAERRSDADRHPDGEATGAAPDSGPPGVPTALRRVSFAWQLASVPLGALAVLVLVSDDGSLFSLGSTFTLVAVGVCALAVVTVGALVEARGAPGTPAATAPFGVVALLTGGVYLSTLVAPGALGGAAAGALVILHGLAALLATLVLLGPAEVDDPVAADESGSEVAAADGDDGAGDAATSGRPGGAAESSPAADHETPRSPAGPSAPGAGSPSPDAADSGGPDPTADAGDVDLPPALSGVAEAAGVDAVTERGQVAGLPSVAVVVDGDPARLVAAPPDGDVDGDAFARAASQWASASGHEAVVTLRAWGTDPSPWLLTERVAPLAFDDAAGRALDDRLDLAVRWCEAVAHAGLYNASQPAFDPERVASAADGPALDGWGAFAALAPSTPPTAYTAPEQLSGSDVDVGRHTTVYRLGAVAYHLLCGVPPHDDADLPGAVSGGVAPPSERGAPASFDGPLGAALALDPEDRYPSARHLALDLEGARPEA